MCENYLTEAFHPTPTVQTQGSNDSKEEEGGLAEETSPVLQSLPPEQCTDDLYRKRPLTPDVHLHGQGSQLPFLGPQIRVRARRKRWDVWGKGYIISHLTGGQGKGTQKGLIEKTRQRDCRLDLP